MRPLQDKNKRLKKSLTFFWLSKSENRFHISSEKWNCKIESLKRGNRFLKFVTLHYIDRIELHIIHIHGENINHTPLVIYARHLFLMKYFQTNAIYSQLNTFHS